MWLFRAQRLPPAAARDSLRHSFNLTQSRGSNSLGVLRLLSLHKSELGMQSQLHQQHRRQLGGGNCCSSSTVSTKLLPYETGDVDMHKGGHQVLAIEAIHDAAVPRDGVCKILLGGKRKQQQQSPRSVLALKHFKEAAAPASSKLSLHSNCSCIALSQKSARERQQSYGRVWSRGLRRSS